MNSLIIYDSQFGNTEKIARAIGQALDNDTKVLRVNEVPANNLNVFNNLNFLIVGSPTQGGRPTSALKKFLNDLPSNALKNVKAAAFDTGIPAAGQKAFLRLVIRFFGYASKRIAAILKTKGATVVGAETFFVLGKEGPLKDGELARAAVWAKLLKTK
jgi:flavodoxin